MKNVEIKLFVTSMLLLELLDEIQSESTYKHQLRFHLKRVSDLLETLLSVKVEPGVDTVLLRASKALESAIDDRDDVFGVFISDLRESIANGDITLEEVKNLLFKEGSN
jgi:predicted RND superfamily exporter protein